MRRFHSPGSVVTHWDASWRLRWHNDMAFRHLALKTIRPSRTVRSRIHIHWRSPGLVDTNEVFGCNRWLFKKIRSYHCTCLCIFWSPTYFVQCINAVGVRNAICRRYYRCVCPSRLLYTETSPINRTCNRVTTSYIPLQNQVENAKPTFSWHVWVVVISGRIFEKGGTS